MVKLNSVHFVPFSFLSCLIKLCFVPPNVHFAPTKYEISLLFGQIFWNMKYLDLDKMRDSKGKFLLTQQQREKPIVHWFSLVITVFYCSYDFALFYTSVHCFSIFCSAVMPLSPSVDDSRALHPPRPPTHIFPIFVIIFQHILAKNYLKETSQAILLSKYSTLLSGRCYPINLGYGLIWDNLMNDIDLFNKKSFPWKPWKKIATPNLFPPFSYLLVNLVFATSQLSRNLLKL